MQIIYQRKILDEEHSFHWVSRMLTLTVTLYHSRTGKISKSLQLQSPSNPLIATTSDVSSHGIPIRRLYNQYLSEHSPLDELLGSADYWILTFLCVRLVSNHSVLLIEVIIFEKFKCADLNLDKICCFKDTHSELTLIFIMQSDLVTKKKRNKRCARRAFLSAPRAGSNWITHSIKVYGSI
jgi:hypothetical protein